MKKEILIAAAVKLYEIGTVSQERGAKMAYQGLSLGKNYLGFPISVYLRRHTKGTRIICMNKVITI